VRDRDDPASVIELDGVSKTYRSLLGRTVHAVEDFSLQVAEGEVLGIAGPNGAGKSTIISLLLGYLRPSRGRVGIHGQAPRTYVEQHGIGYLPELVHIAPRWKTTTALRRFAILAGVPRQDVATRVEAVIAQLGLEEHRDKAIKALSKGNLQRVGLAQALLREQDIYIFDEPTHGLDPVWTQRFRDLIGGLRRPGRTILIASHNLDELQRLADRVAIIDHGRLQRLVTTGYEQPLTGVVTYRLHVTAGGDFVVNVFGQAVNMGKGEFDITVADLAELNRGLADLLARGVIVASLTPAHSVLEEQFRQAVGAEQS